ncbi:MAG: hypothetical protein H7A20_10945 [Rhodanobacteraceae bacterium]|nr:hypothetical protein [Xanthomonadales bacterium]MCP5479274.1 hypothetical protein [Rhodanobacteraceae bacterium]HPF73350.1 hypothetical protein [Xanthomonadaceae bacterium]HRX98780.1 hypothetical protein [Xanthomonadaceae bacterium]
MIQDWLRLPTLALLTIGVVAALLSLWPLVGTRRCLRQRRHMAATRRVIVGLLMMALGLALIALGLSISGYSRLFAESTVADIRIEKLGEQQFVVHLDLGRDDQRRYLVNGDEWRIEARVIRWKELPSVMGVPPLYRMDRLSGRYTDATQEMEAPRSVYSLSQGAVPDLWSLRRQNPKWLPWVDADIGSGVYLPMIDGAHYVVSIDGRGGLLARPDEATQRLLDESGW